MRDLEEEWWLDGCRHEICHAKVLETHGVRRKDESLVAWDMMIGLGQWGGCSSDN